MQHASYALEVIGKDARDFLQRLTTAAVTKIPVGSGTLGALLNAQSKIFGAFTLLFPAPDSYLLVFENEDELHRVQEEFERLHFSEKIEFKKSRSLGGISNGSSSAENSQVFAVTKEQAHYKWPSFIPGKQAVFGESLPALLSETDWEEARIFAGWPLWNADYSAESNALDAGLQPWIHENKGCYPGQEVVERSISVGHPARVLVKLEANIKIKIGDALFADGKEVGKLTSVSPRGISALGIVQWKYRDHAAFGVSEGELRCRK